MVFDGQLLTFRYGDGRIIECGYLTAVPGEPNRISSPPKPQLISRARPALRCPICSQRELSELESVTPILSRFCPKIQESQLT
jgi:hypothetical protein